MKELIITCDHCGKKLNQTNQTQDYIDTEFNTIDDWFQSDLCSKCYAEISQIIKKFCGKKFYEEK